MRTKSTIDAADAAQICDACLQAATSAGASVSIAILDEAGTLLRFVRMEGARGHTIELATRKARSAATTGVSTKLIDAALQAGKLSNIDSMGWGGIPLHGDGECIGAIGVSGSTPEVDDAIAVTAAAMFAKQLGKAA